jgi:small-conductance mechanosensitive channel
VARRAVGAAPARAAGGLGVEELGPDGIRVRLVAKTRPLEQWKVARELRARLKVGFDRAGIEVSAQKVLTANQNPPAA